MPSTDRVFRTCLYLMFTLSGAAGLIYEATWSRYLALFVGHSAYAQIIVLAIFLGGMGIGAISAGQGSERLRDPLLWYAAAELGVGLVGLVFHQAYVAVTNYAYAGVFPLLSGSTALTAAKWGVAGALILPQSVLLGTTFPLMSAGALRRTTGQPGRVLALLYCVNSFGAAAGALIAGFRLVALAGLPGTILAAAVVNFTVAFATYGLARAVAGAPAAAVSAAPSPADQTDSIPAATTAPRLWTLLLGVSFGTAVASFIYEIAWIRMLSLVLGSATHSFELMLSAFILGLSIGAFWLRGRADRWRDPVRALGVIQLGMGLVTLATLPVYVASFGWMATLLQTFARTTSGYAAFNLARYAICLAVMLPATFCAGMTLPLITKILVTGGEGERAIGWVYGVNTLGSIAGVGCASLVLLPALGLKLLLVSGAAVDVGLGILILALLPRRPALPRRLLHTAAAAAVLLIALLSARTALDRVLLTSGVFRRGALPAPGTLDLLFYRDGRTATVAAVREIQTNAVFLTTNGKPDASLDPEWFSALSDGDPKSPFGDDASTQALLALITLAHVPDAHTAVVIGQGSGMSSHLLLGSPAITQLVTIDIEPEMINGSRVFYPLNRRVFDDPRARFVIDDAKAFFAEDGGRYDLILSEPSNPWVSGVSSLFSEEFYARIAPRLSPTGVLGQWLHLYELNDGLVLSVVAALHAHFSAYALYLLNSQDMLIVATNQARLPAPDWSVVVLPQVAIDLRHFLALTPDGLDATFLVDRAALAPLLDHWAAPNSDFFPVLDLGAEEARYLGGYAAGFPGLSAARFDFTAPFTDRPRGFGASGAASIPSQPRLSARALGATLRRGPDPVPGALDGDAAAVHRLWQWHSGLRTDGPPADWGNWLQDAVRVEAEVHGGTAGVVDEEFYRSLHEYLDRHSPPPPVCDAVTFMEALARWDFVSAAAAADRLLPSAAEGHSWIAVDQLCEGGVAAKLLTGDVDGARQYFDALARTAGRYPGDLRLRLLEAYVRFPESVPQPTGPRGHMSWRCVAQGALPRPS